MFDTMTVTKWGGALCGALLIFLLINWASEGLYGGAGGHGGDHAKASYVIETDEEETTGGEEAPAIDMVALVAAADADKGKKVFAKCKACHKLEDGAHGTGPSLFGIVGKDIAAVDGWGYSPAMAALEGNWSIDVLSGFLTKPKTYLPGTKMGFAGLKKDSDRANLIAYLQTIGN